MENLITRKHTTYSTQIAHVFLIVFSFIFLCDVCFCLTFKRYAHLDLSLKKQSLKANKSCFFSKILLMVFSMVIAQGNTMTCLPSPRRQLAHSNDLTLFPRWRAPRMGGGQHLCRWSSRPKEVGGHSCEILFWSSSFNKSFSFHLWSSNLVHKTKAIITI